MAAVTIGSDFGAQENKAKLLLLLLLLLLSCISHVQLCETP